jgi:hypothetical protein
MRQRCRLDEETTRSLRKIHEGRRKKPYSVLIMRGAFVVQFRKASQGKAGQMEGSVEEIDTGKHCQFRSEDELIGFLRGRFAKIWSSSDEEGTDERNDSRR